MKLAPIPQNEKERLQKVREMGILDTENEERFDVLTRDAIKKFDVPISTITIIDDDREWYKSCQGVVTREGPREISFCGHAMLSREIFIIEDTLEDDRFKDNPMVTGEPYIRFYAGVSLHGNDGVSIGVFCIKDKKPRKLSTEEVAMLIDFASRTETELNKDK